MHPIAWRCSSNRAWQFARRAHALQRPARARVWRRGGASRRRLPCQQGTLAVYTPAVARGGTIGAHHPVAGNGDRNAVGGASLCHRAYRLRRSDPLGEVAVTCRRSRRDVADCVPHPLLECSAADIERQIEASRRRLDEADDLGNEPLEALVTADEPPVGKAVLQSAHQCFGIIAELDRAYALVGGRDDNRAERALADRKANDVTATAVAELRRCHTEQTGSGGVKAAVGVETGTIDCFGYSAA